jgi:hypothetical protein
LSNKVTGELKSFAPVGMMEFWNTGMLGFGKTERRFDGQSPYDKAFKTGNYLQTQYSIVPEFHYSTIPPVIFSD